MNLAEIVALTFKFHRAVYISLTQKCPIKCRHCFVESGPEREETADLIAVHKWIDGLVATPGVDIVFFSGGEPYNHPRALRYGLEACAAAGRYSVVATSAFWAKTDAAAARVLDQYPRAACLCISTDIYHEEFVPLASVRIAAKAAKARGIDVTVQIAKSATGYAEFMERYEREVGFDIVPPSEIFIAELNSVGRAATECMADLGADDADSQPIPDAPCVWLGTPWLHEDGVLCACPNLKVFQTENHPLRIGHLTEENFAAVSRRASEDYYIQALRVLGPKGLAETFPLGDWGWDKKSCSGSSICDLCHSLARVPDLPRRIREAIKQDGLNARIDALRLAYYGEMASADVPPQSDAGSAGAALMELKG